MRGYHTLCCWYLGPLSPPASNTEMITVSFERVLYYLKMITVRLVVAKSLRPLGRGISALVQGLWLYLDLFLATNWSNSSLKLSNITCLYWFTIVLFK